ncbi:NAD(P)-binding protein [Fistulina hepatica ATCC 64428]|nr:NAD(P)-binding protein [Fistulina hepatica ATCC 64428]
MSGTYLRIVLNERPIADIDPDKTFRKEVLPIPEPGDDEVLVKVTWVSLDPAMRGWLRNVRSYVPPVQIGETMRAQAIGVVSKVGKNVKDFSIGDDVTGAFGWTEYAVLKPNKLEKVILPPGRQPLDMLHTLGFIGLTAYFGLKDIGQIKKDEKLLVSGAAGAVGSVVCQLGIQAGAQVYAIAGTPEKCKWLEKDIGVVKAFNYKDGNLNEDLKAVGYFDVFFDNVGGEILDLALLRLNKDARIVLCGAISAYNSAKPRPLQNYQTLIAQRGRMQGFIVFDYAARFPEARQVLAAGLADGSIKQRFYTVKGLQNAPSALNMLYSGQNDGKL